MSEDAKAGPASTRARMVPLVVLLTIVWGTNWGLFRLAVAEVSVWTFRAVCLLGSGSALLLVARFRGISLHVPRPERGPLAVAGLSYLVVWNIASTYSAVLLPSGQAAVLGFTMPVWVTLISWIFLHEVPSRRLIAGVVLAACGVVLLAVAARSGHAANAPLGFALGISAGIGWAIGTILLKRARLSVTPIVSTAWQLIIAGVPIALVAVGLGERELSMPSGMTFLVIGYITLVPMALGNVAWFSIVHMLPANLSGLASVMVPVVAMLTGAAFLGEPLGWLEFTAMGCCGAALLLMLSTPAADKTA